MMTKEERREYHRKWVLQNKEKARSYSYNYKIRKRGSIRAYNLALKYGITFEEYDAILKHQGNKCKICGARLDGGTKETKPHLDHSHITKQIRGILCGHCNLGLGYFKDNRGLLLSAAQYLTQ